MSRWAQRKAAIKAESDYDSLTTIPMIEFQDPKPQVVVERIAEAFKSVNARRIYVADPYLNETDVDLVRRMFDGVFDREVTIITRFDNVPAEPLTLCSKCRSDTAEVKGTAGGKSRSERRSDVVKVVKNTVVDLTNKRIFKSLRILVANVKFHDRFIFCYDDGSKGLLLWCGTSLNHFMSQYSGIVRISNRSFKRQVVKFIELVESDSKSLDSLLAEIENA